MVCWWSVTFIIMLLLFFFFKQKTAYEMRISDWSSDVCSSDLYVHPDRHGDRRRLGLQCCRDARPAGLSAGIPQRRRHGRRLFRGGGGYHRARVVGTGARIARARTHIRRDQGIAQTRAQARDRKSGGEGKSGSVRVDLGGPRTIQKK